MIKETPFKRYHTEKQADTFTIRLNETERNLLESCKILIEQPKDSTALKQLAKIGAEVIHTKEMANILQTIFDNKRKNNRLGIVDFD